MSMKGPTNQQISYILNVYWTTTSSIIANTSNHYTSLVVNSVTCSNLAIVMHRRIKAKWLVYSPGPSKSYRVPSTIVVDLVYKCPHACNVKMLGLVLSFDIFNEFQF